MNGVCSAVGLAGATLDDEAVEDVIGRALASIDAKGKKVLLIVPDSTRTAPVGQVFKTIHRQLNSLASAVDVMIALGTHPPMTEEAIRERLEITEAERTSTYASVKFLNHAWNDPSELQTLGIIPAKEIAILSDGLFSMDVPVEINRNVLAYDQIIMIGPVFPHEVVGFSGGNKYLFPGVGGPAILNFFHWLGAVITNPMIIGHKWTPVRKVVDRAASMVPVPKLCFCLVVEGSTFAGIFAGTPELAWDAASDLSERTHLEYRDAPFQTVLSCAPAMYDELWVGGKCMYKLEPVVADGGELIIYAPHIQEISIAHGGLIREIGYHCRDYFLKQWDRFKDYPWGVLAHSTHVRGVGTFEDGVERCRIQVTLATGISESVCREINLGYRDPASIRKADFANREEQGVLLVPKAGERLFRLKTPGA